MQCAAVAVAGRGEYGGIVFAPCIEHRLNGLRAVVIAEQDHSFNSILEALTDGIIQLGHAMEKCLTGFDRQFSLGGISQCLQLRQRIAAGVFEQAHHQRRALDLAQEIDEMLHPGQDGGAVIGSLFARTFR
ncbi:hypothetical protein FQZ97_899960 [compost metagenome]